LSDLKSLPDGTKIIIDSNIILYTALAHPVFQRSCTDFLMRIEKGEIQGFIPSVVVQEIAYHFIVSELMEKGYGKNVSDCVASYKRDPLIMSDLSRTWTEIRRLFTINCSILYDNPEIVRNSFSISHDFFLLTKDAYIASFAQSHQIAHIATNDKDFFRVPWLSVWRPEPDEGVR
jgi:predicted nucleic acid-binding protein